MAGTRVVRPWDGFFTVNCQFFDCRVFTFFFDDSEASQAAGKLHASQQGKARLGEWDECQVRLRAKHGNRQTGRWM